MEELRLDLNEFSDLNIDPGAWPGGMTGRE